VLDVGHRLETEQAQAVTRLSGAAPAAWSPDDLELIRMQPAARAVRGLPEKRAYGSDFPFHDAGQLDGVSGTGQVNDAVISGAYGGLSNVWGAQVMVFTPATFSNWPVDSSEMEHHYRAVLGEIPYAGEEDALARRFPLVGSAAPLPRSGPPIHDGAGGSPSPRRRPRAVRHPGRSGPAGLRCPRMRAMRSVA
jgi:hypothetical protein